MTVEKRHNWPDQKLKQALLPLTRRALSRYWLETLRLILVWGLAVAAGALVILKLTPLCFFPSLAWIFGAVAMISVLILRIYFFPDALKIVRVADELGLNARAITAYRLLEKNNREPWNRAAIKEGLNACEELEYKKMYPFVPSWRLWKGIAVLAGALLVVSWLPSPLASCWEARQAEKEALATAALKAREVVEQIKQLPPEQKELLPEKLQQDLNKLAHAAGKAKDRQEGAENLERAGQEIEDALALLEPARRDAQQLAGAWKNSSEALLQKMADALEKGDPEEIAGLAKELQELAGSTGSGKKEVALNLFQAAETVSDSHLRKSLRKLARTMLSPAGDKETKQAGSESINESLSQALASLAQRAKTAARLERASSAMFNLANALNAGGASQAIARAGGGSDHGTSGSSSTGSAGGGYSTNAPSGSSGTNNGAGGSGIDGSAASSSGSGGSSSGGGNSGGNGNPGNGTGSGEGTGQGEGGSNGGEGSGSGITGHGGGTGTGAGGSGSGGQGAGTAGGGFDRIYAPFLLGGSGQESRVSGQIRPGSAGTETALPKSPAGLGAVRPYKEVLPLYKEEAVNSLSATPLPPNLESLVWQYFSSLE